MARAAQIRVLYADAGVPVYKGPTWKQMTEDQREARIREYLELDLPIHTTRACAELLGAWHVQRRGKRKIYTPSRGAITGFCDRHNIAWPGGQLHGTRARDRVNQATYDLLNAVEGASFREFENAVRNFRSSSDHLIRFARQNRKKKEKASAKK
jgi:hypothetical protein